MLKVVNVSKQFQIPGGFVGAVDNLDLVVDAGEFFVLLGPSGCGKTTLLRCIAGLERPDQGEIHLHETLLSSAKANVFVEPEDRDIAMVFQSYAIWPHMTVFDNVAYPLTEGKRRSFSHEQVAAKTRQALALVQLERLERHSAATLSGGQQQRVALARALVRKPKLLLMDEPLSNLDAKLREEMRDQITELTRALGVTTIHVTHDQVEAMALADRMAVMQSGHIIELGNPEDLYRKPQTRIVAEFLGRTNWLEATVRSRASVECSVGVLECGVPESLSVGTRASVGIRPEWIELTTPSHVTPSNNMTNRLDARIKSRMFLGESCLYKVSLGDTILLVKADSSFPPHGPVTVVIPPERCMVLSVSEAKSTIIEASVAV